MGTCHNGIVAHGRGNTIRVKSIILNDKGLICHSLTNLVKTDYPFRMTEGILYKLMNRALNEYDMEDDVKYLTDKKGKRTAVQVPYEDWKQLTQENQKLKQLLRVKADLQEVFQEVDDDRKGITSLKTLDQDAAKKGSLAEKRRANRGMSKGLVIMADNFDDPLEDFEDYT